MARASFWRMPPEPPGQPVAGLGQAGPLQQPADPPVQLAGGQAVGAAGEAEVLVDGEVGPDARAGGDVAEPALRRPPDRARGRPDRPGEGPQQARLAGAVPPTTAATVPAATSKVTSSRATVAP